MRIFLCVLLLASRAALAHHGVAGVGAAGLNGPGAPIESANSATLPQGSTLGYMKLDHARYRTFDDDPANPEAKYANFWMAGLGHGFTPWFSGYVFVPYNEKIDEPGGFSTRGVADISLMGQVGFKYDRGLRLIPESESLDDLEDWRFTIFGGGTLPTGNPNLRDANGNIDPSKSTGFGRPSYSIGVTATKMVAPRWTANAELSHLQFRQYTYADGNSTRFGPEYRANGSLAYRFITNAEAKFRLDLCLEGQYLRIGRDRTNGEYDAASGGKVFYALPGVRLYLDRASVAIGVKKPVWTDLNEESDQQGSEGRERYRFIFSASVLF
ncbi:MAG TPA: transporter [Burkholderiales bacterium]|nr:transporter [Burkholderiales bacterium]